jgi:hypothetical protein
MEVVRHMSAASLLDQWENFYVIVGSAAGALTGLQFVVIALINDVQAATSMREIRAFGTPTVVHFCAVLLVSAIVSAPWEALSAAGWMLSACGAVGVVYAITVIRHARGQTHYSPDARICSGMWPFRSRRTLCSWLQDSSLCDTLRLLCS